MLPKFKPTTCYLAKTFQAIHSTKWSVSSKESCNEKVFWVEFELWTVHLRCHFQENNGVLSECNEELKFKRQSPCQWRIRYKCSIQLPLSEGFVNMQSLFSEGLASTEQHSARSSTDNHPWILPEERRSGCTTAKNLQMRRLGQNPTGPRWQMQMRVTANSKMR